MTLKQKTYNTLAALAFVGAIGGMGGAMYYGDCQKKPECVTQVNQLEREVNEYFGHKEVMADPTAINERKETLDLYEKMLFNPEVVATLEQYDTEKERRGTNTVYMGLGALVTLFLGVGSLVNGIKAGEEKLTSLKKNKK